MPNEVQSERGVRPWAVPDHGEHRWGWMLAEGVVLCVLGVLAIGSATLATLATVILVGALLLVAGVMNLMHAFRMGRWQGFLLHMLLGVLYAAAGVLFLYAPVAAAISLTLLVAVVLFTGGVARLAIAIGDRDFGWGWLAMSGVASIVLGVIVAANWPQASIFLIGLFVGLELLFVGVALISQSLLIRRAEQRFAPEQRPLPTRPTAGQPGVPPTHGDRERPQGPLSNGPRQTR